MDVEDSCDRVIARLQQPFPLEYIHVDAEYQILVFTAFAGFFLDKQKDFSELLQSAASDYGTLVDSVSDIHWTHNFREPPSVWR
ncbi:augmin subunit 2-like protein, partial [Tanacetum coccineum]